MPAHLLMSIDLDELPELSIEMPRRSPQESWSNSATRAENGERLTHQGVRAAVQHFAETGELHPAADQIYCANNGR
jgi:hypothetical protein